MGNWNFTLIEFPPHTMELMDNFNFRYRVDYFIEWTMRKFICKLIGKHIWGPEQEYYELLDYNRHIETWRECKVCEAQDQLWSIYNAR